MTPATPVSLHLATTDPDTANEALQQVYSRARMGTVRDRTSFLYSQDVDGDSDLNLGQLTFRGRIAGHMVVDGAFSVMLPRAGGVSWRIDGRAGGGPGLFLLQPGQEYYGEVDRLSVASVNLGPETLRRTARDVHGDESLEVAFDGPHPVSPGRARYWRSTHEFVSQALTDPAVAAVPLLRTDLLRRMSVATLETFAFLGDPRTRRTSTTDRQSAYRRAVEYMRAQLSSPITVEDVARHAGLSTIELTRAFRSHTGTTPGGCLRELRLAAAHQDLLQADPEAGDTVRAIALRWGMVHSGDFARRHRQVYGESPVETLRR
ncbi:helix-turn-helix transcriptional regulator [Kocuria oceani]|uniref:Helix-turn-helix transcriptional regulator n=1 Tax=Kocuria oceani TaxID=988827 RepID=A0ABV9TJU7_9MICC|nr:helix-turn-helix transcriptional regulator [Kocuria oceani]